MTSRSMETSPSPASPDAPAATACVMEGGGLQQGGEGLHHQQQQGGLTAKEPQAKEGGMEASADVEGVASDMPNIGDVATAMEVDRQERPLISIDGSVMEGVSISIRTSNHKNTRVLANESLYYLCCSTIITCGQAPIVPLVLLFDA